MEKEILQVEVLELKGKIMELQEENKALFLLDSWAEEELKNYKKFIKYKNMEREYEAYWISELAKD